MLTSHSEFPVVFVLKATGTSAGHRGTNKSKLEQVLPCINFANADIGSIFNSPLHQSTASSRNNFSSLFV